MILVTIRSAMNQAAPINRLPPEILGRVLEFREGDKDLISATHVCNRWRSVLTSTPPLWTGVVFLDSNRALAYLTRSGGLPIDVSFIPTRIAFETWKFDPEDFYTSRIPWFDRVKSMAIGGDEGQIEAILRRLCLPAPLLQSIKFSGRPNRSLMLPRAPGTVRFPREFLGSQAPSLRSLSFDSISPVSVAKLPLTNLTSFTWTDKDSEATVTGLVSLLESAPLLELLTLHLRIRSVSTAERTTTVTLNKLRELTWSNSGGTFSLTSCLITPELHWLSLRLVPPLDLQTDLATILPPHEGHFPLLTEPTEVKYTTRRGTRLCQFQSATNYVSIYVSISTPMGNYDEIHAPWFLRNAAIHFKQIKQMTIEVDFPPLGEFPGEQFESLETLELADGGNNYFTLIQPYFREFSTIPVIPFPALLEVRIGVDLNTPLARLVEILTQRKQAGYGVKTVKIRGECDEVTNEAVAGIRESVDEVVLQLTHKIGCTGH